MSGDTRCLLRQIWTRAGTPSLPVYFACGTYHDALLVVSGGVKIDHWDAEKGDQFTGSGGVALKDLRGRREHRPATRLAQRASLLWTNTSNLGPGAQRLDFGD